MTTPSDNSQRFHRWSGWPGAFCLDCGADDEVEWCLATSCWGGWKPCQVCTEEGDYCSDCCGTRMIVTVCPIHQNGPCENSE